MRFCSIPAKSPSPLLFLIRPQRKMYCASAHLLSLLTLLTLSFLPSAFFPPLFYLFPPSPRAASSPANPSRLARPLLLRSPTLELKCILLSATYRPWLFTSLAFFPSVANAQCAAEPLLPSPHSKPSPKPAEKEALLAPGLQVHHTLPEQHLQQILQGAYYLLHAGHNLPWIIMRNLRSGASPPVLPLCRRSPCPRSWRCARPGTSLWSPRARTPTASSSLPAKCAISSGRIPTLCPQCPRPSPRLSRRPLPRPAKWLLIAAWGARWPRRGRAPSARPSCRSYSRTHRQPQGTHLTVSGSHCSVSVGNTPG